MFICGNEFQQNILHKIFEKNFEGKNLNKFIILSGPKNIGKTTLVKKLCKKFLGNHFDVDFLFLADLSEYMDKKHYIKVDSEDDGFLDIPGYGKFINYGARQIIDWLSKTPVGKMKILLLENIERMTNSAANAFLKIFEESFKNIMIIATTTNSSFIIETILSRAFLINFNLPTTQEIKTKLKNDYPEIDDKKLDLIISFSINRIGFAKKIIESQNNEKNFDDLLTYFEKFINLFEKDGYYNEKIDILNQVHKIGFLQPFIDSLIFYFEKKGNYKNIDKLLNFIEKSNSNVAIENLLFELVL